MTQAAWIVLGCTFAMFGFEALSHIRMSRAIERIGELERAKTSQVVVVGSDRHLTLDRGQQTPAGAAFDLGDVA